MPESIPYLPGRSPPGPRALGRYLPPIPGGVVTDWLRAHLAPDPIESANQPEKPAPWVLDPFGADPRLAVETARAGCRILVAANNPIARFLLEMEANRPDQSELRAALADLAASRKGEERLEPHLRALYLTRCEQCDTEISPEAFIWERGASPGDAPALVARIYHCPFCGDSGEHPAAEEDIARAAQFSAGGLHRARALERVASRDDPDRSHVEDAIGMYLPRAVYALFTLVNRLDSLSTPAVPITTGAAAVRTAAGRQRLLEALFLVAFDQANTLWPHPFGRARPRQLTIPPRFRENNIWLALEQAVEIWTDRPGNEEPAVPLTLWPELPPEQGGICLFEGRLKDLVEIIQNEQPSRIQIGAVVAALPRPNQAFWTLSALWAGWLWGREAVGPFKSVLRRRRYDWSWHTSALRSALDHLQPLLKPKTPFFGLIGEVEPGFLSAALIASDLSGFELSGIALRPEISQAQILWRRKNDGDSQAANEADIPASPPVQVAANAAQAYLRERGEPASYLHILAAALTGLVQAGGIKGLAAGDPDPTSPASTAEVLARLNTVLDEALSYRKGFLRYGGSDKSSESGQWWLRDAPGPSSKAGPAASTTSSAGFQPPLSDRIEIALVRQLIKKPRLTWLEIDTALCTQFTGLLTPDPELIQVCLTSYGEQSPPGSGRWCQRQGDSPKRRRADLQTSLQLLETIARTLGFKTEGRSPLLYLEPDDEVKYAWYITASAVIGSFVQENPYPPAVSVIALPDERSNLLAYKLDRNPYLRQLIAAGWRFINLRQLHWLSEHPSLSVKVLEEQLAHRLAEYSAPQMRLL